MAPEEQERMLARLNDSSRNTLMSLLGIRYSAVGSDFLEATMPVGPDVHQPMGLLHGGATAALAESVGSAASVMRVDIRSQSVVGTALSVNHLRGKREGQVTARAEPLHLGRKTHLWEIKVRDEFGQLVADARLSMMVLERA